MHVHIAMAWTQALFRQFLDEGRPGLDERIINGKGWRYYQTLEHHHQMYESLRPAVKPEDLKLVTREFLEWIAKNDGAVYAEVQNSYRADPIAFESQIDAISEGIAEARTSTGIEARINVSCLRDHGGKNAEEAARFLVDYKRRHPDTFVTSLSTVGSERPEHGSLLGFRNAFNITWNEAGMGLNPHVAEQYVVNAVDFFGAIPAEALATPEAEDGRRLRAGHATLIHMSSELMQRFRDHGICIESCPSSNKRLGLPDHTMRHVVGDIVTGHNGQDSVTLNHHLSMYFNNIVKHPLARFRRYGIPVCLGSDNPFLDNTSIGKEYSMAVLAGIPQDERALLQFTRDGIRYANIDNNTRAELMAKLDTYEAALG